jgi:cytochrome b561
MLCLGFFMGDIENKVIKGEVFNIHKLIGLTILTLMILRLIWTVINPKPKLPIETFRWERILEKGMHSLLYFALILMPISGWILSTAAGKPPHLGLYRLPLPISQSKNLAHFGNSVHLFLAWVILALVTLHILAAFKHYLINKDNVLQRMIPWVKID